MLVVLVAEILAYGGLVVGVAIFAQAGHDGMGGLAAVGEHAYERLARDESLVQFVPRTACERHHMHVVVRQVHAVGQGLERIE